MYGESFFNKKWDLQGCTLFFLFLLKNIDCGYTLEPPRQGGSNKYPQSMFEQKYEKYQNFCLKTFSFWWWNFQYRRVFVMWYVLCSYSKTSITRTPMALLPWLIRTLFWRHRKFFWERKKQIFRDILMKKLFLLCEHVYCVYLLESPHRHNTKEYTQYKIIL